MNQSGSIDISDRMFLGGRIQSNLPTVQEEDNEISRQSVSSTDSSFSQLLGVGQEGSSMEAEATHQLVTLVMDFLSYPGANKGRERSEFVKTESYEVIQMSHYLGVLMGYDIKVGEFTGNPRRLRYRCHDLNFYSFSVQFFCITSHRLFHDVVTFVVGLVFRVPRQQKFS